MSAAEPREEHPQAEPLFQEEQGTLDAFDGAWARGASAEAAANLIPLLEARGRRGDRLAAAAARALRDGPFAPDALAAALDRLVALVRAQEAQIRALQDMVERS